jgi:hypothetical protein
MEPQPWLGLFSLARCPWYPTTHRLPGWRIPCCLPSAKFRFLPQYRFIFMPVFVVSLRLPDTFDEEFIAIIPRHRDFISRLLNEKIVESYAISSDRSRGWVTMNGDDAAAVQAVVEQFPLYRFLRGVEIDELFIFDSTASRFPHINLN